MNRVFKAQNDAFQISRFPKNKEVSMPKVSAYFTLDRIAGKHQVKELKKQLDTLGGIFSVSVNDQKEKVAVDYDTSGSELEHILRKIEKLGYRVLNTEVDHRTDMSQRPSS
jgi:copper chaperone CopZ